MNAVESTKITIYINFILDTYVHYPYVQLSDPKKAHLSPFHPSRILNNLIMDIFIDLLTTA